MGFAIFSTVAIFIFFPWCNLFVYSWYSSRDVRFNCVHSKNIFYFNVLWHLQIYSNRLVNTTDQSRDTQVL